MSNIEQRLADYRHLRESSKKVLMDDIEHARTTFSTKGLANRYLGGVAQGAKDVYEVAKVHTVDNRGVIAIVLGALALWFGREPLLAAMAEEIEAGELETVNVTDDTVQPSETDIVPEDASSGDTNDK